VLATSCCLDAESERITDEGYCSPELSSPVVVLPVGAGQPAFVGREGDRGLFTYDMGGGREPSHTAPTRAEQEHGLHSIVDASP
jgi:hypothetical protein